MMEFTHAFRTIETHTGGNPTRTVISGVPRIPGDTMLAKLAYFREHCDWIRQALMYEPRGHDVMSGCILTDPVSPEADYGVLFIEVGGYLLMNGHDTIGLVTALVESGQVPAQEATPVVLDTPAGLVHTVAHVRDGRVVSVSFDNVPAFAVQRNVAVDVPDLGSISVDIAWGGNFFGLVDAGKLCLDLQPERAHAAIALAQVILGAVNRQVDVRHPELPGVHGITHVEFFAAPTDPAADVRNMIVVPAGGVDRSPSGTGTCARAALLYASGKVPVGGTIVDESVTGALFRATIIEAARVGPYDAVRVRVTGSAHMYGDSTFVLDPDDALQYGFLLS